MSKYLKKFENHTQYENYINGSGAILPNVSICTTEGDVHYNPSTPPTPVETRLVAKYNVEDTEFETQLCNDTTNFSAIEIDGVAQPSVVSAYTFSTTGEHTVKYTLADPTSIYDYVFYNCFSLTSIVIPDSVTSIGNNAFQDCSILTSCTIGSGVTSIGESAFYYCITLTSIDIPNSVTSIGDYAFGNCVGLSSIDIPSGVTSIGESVFQECSSLTSCTIGSGVISIGSSAFYNNGLLESVTIMATTPPSIGDSIFGGEMSTPTIYVPSASVEAYKAAEGWSDYTENIEPIS